MRADRGVIHAAALRAPADLEEVERILDEQRSVVARA
jgi:hypothetical protein